MALEAAQDEVIPDLQRNDWICQLAKEIEIDI